MSRGQMSGHLCIGGATLWEVIAVIDSGAAHLSLCIASSDNKPTIAEKPKNFASGTIHGPTKRFQCSSHCYI